MAEIYDNDNGSQARITGDDPNRQVAAAASPPPVVVDADVPATIDEEAASPSRPEQRRRAPSPSRSASTTGSGPPSISTSFSSGSEAVQPQSTTAVAANGAATAQQNHYQSHPHRQSGSQSIRQRKKHNRSSKKMNKKNKKKHHDGDNDHPDDDNPVRDHKRRKSNKNHRRRRRRRKWRWTLGKPKDLSREQERVFMHMQLRKMNRALTGRRTRKQKREFLFLGVYFIVMFAIVSYNTSVKNSQMGRVIILGLQDILIVVIYIVIVAIVTTLFRGSRFITLLYWMFIYLPLVAMITSFSLQEHGSIKGYIKSNQFVWVLLGVAEVVVVAIFMGLYYLYPRIVNSDWFRKKSRAGTFWRVKVISDWTMTYVASWGKRFMCKYEGERNEEGLPHGFGRWLDDSFDGEVMTGHWSHGEPIAPFLSRHYGTGDTFKAVRVAYIMASDDEFSKSNFHASNEQPPRCGITSVECSISGSFYNELPLATHLIGPNWLDDYSVAAMCRELKHLGAEEDNTSQCIQIKANDPRGVQVTGHIYEPTGEPFNASIDRVTVMVEHENQPQLKTSSSVRSNNLSSLTRTNSLNFMPRASRQSFRPDHIIVYDDDGSSSSDGNDRQDDSEDKSRSKHSIGNSGSDDDDDDDNNNNNNSNSNSNSNKVELRPIHEDHSRHSTSSTNTSHPPGGDVESQLSPNEQTDRSNRRNEVGRMVNASLKIPDWVPVTYKEALIFFPGYKVTLKEALESFGQFISMTKLDNVVYPIVFEWPVGQRFSYHGASRTACDEKNRENVCRLLKGLQEAGIRHVHFMSHSLGVQTLISAFADKRDGSRNSVSECFQLDPDFIDEDDASYFANTNGIVTVSASGENPPADTTKLLICKTITMINPDFPVEAFVDRGFETLRRHCGTVTIIGDQKDQALFLSQILNGVLVYFGYQQPEVLHPWLLPDNASFAEKRQQSQRRMLQPVIGRSIELLYFPDDLNKEDIDDALLFTLRAPVMVSSDDQVQDRAWLDVDVIDTTGLDTNLNGIRHSGFNLNPILLKDLEELISSGSRAIQRATLLYRDGNLFSYCHAPSYVSNL